MAEPGDVAFFAAQLERLYRRVPFSVTSWWRTPAHNRDVKGEADSRHLDGVAADCEPDSPLQLPELQDAARELSLHVKLYSKHAHVQLDPVRPKLA